MPIQITKSGTLLSCSKEELEKMQKEFDKNHGLLLPKFIGSSLLRKIQEQINNYKFIKRENYGQEGYMMNNTIRGLLYFLLNDKKLFKILEQLTGYGPIGHIEGRIYRFTPGYGHHDRWHDDITGHRLFTISINLSTEVYEGGVLQIRDRNSKKVLTKLPNTGFGDAIIFRIDKKIEHKLTNVRGTASKTAFAGWFSSKPTFEVKLKMLPLKSKAARIHSRQETSNDRKKNLTGKIKINRGIIYKTLGDNTVFFNLNTGVSCGINSTGNKFWQLIAKYKKLSEVFDVLKKEFDVHPQTLQHDILSIVNQLHSNGIVEVVH